MDPKTNLTESDSFVEAKQLLINHTGRSLGHRNAFQQLKVLTPRVDKIESKNHVCIWIDIVAIMQLCKSFQ